LHRGIGGQRRHTLRARRSLTPEFAVSAETNWRPPRGKSPELDDRDSGHERGSDETLVLHHLEFGHFFEFSSATADRSMNLGPGRHVDVTTSVGARSGACPEPVYQASGLGIDEETIAAGLGNEPLGDALVDDGEQTSEESGDVEQPHRLLVQAKLLPSQDLEKLIERAQSPRQCNETVSELCHHGLSLMHGTDDAKIREPTMWHLSSL